MGSGQDLVAECMACDRARQPFRFRPVIAVDFDGVIASWRLGSFDTPGPPIPGAKQFLENLRESGSVMIYTSRCTEEYYKPQKASTLRQAVAYYMETHDLPYDEIWTGQGKPLAGVYIDDRAIRCCPEADELAYGRTEAMVMQIIAANKEEQ